MSTPPPSAPLFGVIDQSPTLSALFGTLIAAGVLALLYRVPKLKPIYTAVGRGITRFFKWFWSLRMNGAITRESIRKAGYAEREAEIVAERAVAPEPSWKIDARDALGERNIHWLENHGYEVFDVGITVHPEFFQLEAEVAWQGSFGTNLPGGYIGQYFRGVTTDRGKAEGVMFHVTWQDRNGDPQERDVLFPPDEIRAGNEEALREEWAKGRMAGRTEVIEERQSALSNPAPRWSIRRVLKDNSRHHVLINYELESVVTDVRLDAPADRFEFNDAARWDKLEVLDDHSYSQGDFDGRVKGLGRTAGVMFTVTWLDELGAERSAQAHLEKPPRATPSITVL